MNITACKSLGEICGSISQNFGFCGPEFVDKVEMYVTKAQRAFGGSSIPDLYEDWRRQFNYLVYAYLDAGRWEEAEKILFRYLNVGSFCNLGPRLKNLDRWEHALLARFFADTGTPGALDFYCLGSTVAEPVVVERRHPWQLWSKNMARIAAFLGDMDKAAGWYRQSLDLCVSEPSGATVKAMALLALAGLHEIGRLEAADLEKGKKPVLEALSIINPNRFQPLISAGFEAMPALVAAEPNRYFPFSYR